MQYLLLSLLVIISGGILYWLWIPDTWLMQLFAVLALLILIMSATKLIHDIVADEPKTVHAIFFKKTLGGS